jgi:hypothetical protein
MQHAWEMTNSYKNLVGKSKRKWSRMGICYRLEDNIKMDRIRHKSRDSSVDIALGYGLDDWGSRVRFPAGAGNFSLYYRVQNGSGAHPTS